MQPEPLEICTAGTSFHFLCNSTICATTQNSEKFEGTTQVLPSVYRTTEPTHVRALNLRRKNLSEKHKQQIYFLWQIWSQLCVQWWEVHPVVLQIKQKTSFYHPRMWIGNNFTQVFLSVCLFVQAIAFELLNLGTSFLLYRIILTISRSSLSIKIIEPRPNE